MPAYHNRTFYEDDSEGRHPSSDVPSNGATPAPSTNVQIKKSLYEALEIMRRQKWMILGVAVLIFGAAALYTFMMEPEYSASTIVFVNPKTAEAVTNDELTSGIADNAAMGRRNLESQVLLLRKSPYITEQTAEWLREMETLPESDRPLPILQAWQQVSGKKDLAEFLQEEYIYVDKISGRARAVNIEAVSSHPVEAALIANLFSKAYVKRTQEWSRRHLTVTRQFLENQITRRKAELDSLENRLSQYMQQAEAADLEAKTSNLVTRVAEIKAALDAARAERQKQQALLESIQTELEKIQPRLAQRVASNVEAELKRKQEQLAELQVRLNNIYSENPELVNQPPENEALANQLSQLKQNIERLEQEVQELSAQYIEEMSSVGGANISREGGGLAYVAHLKRQAADARVAINGAEAKIRTLQQRLAEYEQTLQNIPEQSVELAALRREHASTEKLYKRLVDRLQEVRIAEESTTAFAEIIRPARIPEAPDSPNIPKNLASGLVLGLMMGLMAAFVRHKFDSRIHTPEHVRQPDYPMLGVIPDMKQIKLGQTSREIDKKDGAIVVRNNNTPVAAQLDPASPIAEAYRRLSLNLRFMRPGANIQTILITSPEAGAGKSTTASNLAATMARAGIRTLVVDADLRRPTLHKHIAQSGQPTLEDLLLEPVPDIDPARFRTTVDNLYAITTPEPIPGAIDLLSSKNVYNLIERMKGVFDIIIFDSPPVLLATDGAYLARHCDATVVVASADSTDKTALLQTLDELKGIGTKIAGIVLNRFDATNTFGYDATYKYRYGYYSSYYSQETT